MVCFTQLLLDYDLNVHHTKAVVIANKDKDEFDPLIIYVGSHNMSAGAWGSIVAQQVGFKYCIVINVKIFIL